MIKKDSDVQNSYSSLEYEMKKIMGKCFKLQQKIYKNTGRGNDYEVYYTQLRQYLKEGKIQRNIAKRYIDKLKQPEVEKYKRRKVEKLKDITSKLRKNNKLKPEGFWSLKRVMKEGKNSTCQCGGKWN